MPWSFVGVGAIEGDLAAPYEIRATGTVTAMCGINGADVIATLDQEWGLAVEARLMVPDCGEADAYIHVWEEALTEDPSAEDGSEEVYGFTGSVSLECLLKKASSRLMAGRQRCQACRPMISRLLAMVRWESCALAALAASVPMLPMASTPAPRWTWIYPSHW